MLLFDTPRIDWLRYFSEASFPHDPFDHQVAADWYEDIGDTAQANRHRELASFWGLVQQNKEVRPVKDAKNWWWGIKGASFKKLKNCPEELYLYLPVDAVGDLPYTVNSMVYNTETKAWTALFEAWAKAGKPCQLTS